MKRFLNIFLSFIILCLIIVLPACSNKDNNNSTNSSNEEYYLALGYHSITFDKYSTINYDNSQNNLVNISENKIMLPHNAKFSISFNLEDNPEFELNNSNIINFNTGKILSGFTNDNDNYEINNNSITLKNNLNISAVFDNFKTLGVALFPITEENSTLLPTLSGKFNSITNIEPDNLLYYYSKDGSYESFENNNNQIVSMATYHTTTNLLQNNTFELDIWIEIYFNTTAVNAYLILEDGANNYYFYQKDFADDFINNSLNFESLSNENSSIEKIKISLTYDITTKDEY